MNNYMIYRLLYLHKRLAEIQFKALIDEVEIVRSVVEWKILKVIGPYYLPEV